MSEFFDARHSCPAVRKATRAFADSMLEDLLPPMRAAAGGVGYAIAVHGSLARDIDLVAIPWAANARSAEELVKRLVAVATGVVGNACSSQDWADKPHGRRAVTIIMNGMCPELDLSIMPLIAKTEND